MAKAKYTKGKDGYFQTKVWDGTYDANGKKHRATLRTDQSSKHLEDMVRELKEQVENRNFVKPTEYTVLDYSRLWLSTYKAGVEKNTAAMYRNIIEKHLDGIKDVRISDITKTHILLAINDVVGKPRIQEQLLMTLKQIVKAAITDKYLPAGLYDEIFEGVRAKSRRKSKKRALTASERQAVFSAPFSDKEKAFVYILYGCGLRRGEALALTIFDFDFKANTLRVNKSLAFDENEPYIKTTKTENGVREVPIPSKVLPFLKKYWMSLRGEQLFRTGAARYMSKSSYRRMWEQIQEKMGAPTLTAHIFRHNYCTTLCYQIPTISIKRIAELMGDTEKMVIEVYNHVLAEKEDVKTAVEQALNF